MENDLTKGDDLSTLGPLEAVMVGMKADRPSISEAMKNYCSFLAATSAAEEATAKPKQKYDLPQLLACAKVVLRQVNAHVLPDPGDWASQHPQGDEAALARIEALTAFKAAYLLNQQITQTAGAKATKLLGRQYLQATGLWQEGVRASAAAELASQRFAPAVIDAFLDGWTSALTGEDENAASLVWAADFQATLQQRQRQRISEVRERRERLDAGETEAQRLREAMAHAAPDMVEEAEGEGEDEARIVEM